MRADDGRSGASRTGSVYQGVSEVKWLRRGNRVACVLGLLALVALGPEWASADLLGTPLDEALETCNTAVEASDTALWAASALAGAEALGRHYGLYQGLSDAEKRVDDYLAAQGSATAAVVLQIVRQTRSALLARHIYGLSGWEGAMIEAEEMLTSAAALRGRLAETEANYLNLDFEAGSLAGWTVATPYGGRVQVVREGQPFAGAVRSGSRLTDTEQIGFLNGRCAASLISSGPGIPPDAVVALTSKPFVCEYSRLEWDQMPEDEDSVISVFILDGLTNEAFDGERFDRTRLRTFRNDVYWERFAYDLSRFRGMWIRIQFQQHTEYALDGWFALLDNITLSP